MSTRTIEISEETYTKLKEQFGADIQDIDINSLDDFVGKKWFFRTVTNYLVGQVSKRIGNILILEQASWIGHTGRFADFIKDGVQTSTEVEPVGRCGLNFGGVIDFYEWRHKLPKDQQ